MIQRIQTVYMLLSVVAIVLCLCFPVAYLTADNMGVEGITLFNLCAVTPEGYNFSTIGLFMELSLVETITIFNIFCYKNRRWQMIQCLTAIILLFLWIAHYVVIATVWCPEGYTFTVSWAACLPCVALILLWLARRGVIADEKLVRAVDRIR